MVPNVWRTVFKKNDPVHLRHLVIRDNGIERAGFEDRKTFYRRQCRGYCKLGSAFKIEFTRVQEVFFIIDIEDAVHGKARALSSNLPAGDI